MKTQKLIKWGFVIPTKEYGGEVIGGLGLGAFLTTAITSPDHRIINPLVWFGSFGCICLVVLVAVALIVAHLAAAKQ